MRIWSLHPRYLDSKGLVALWREALLAQAVLAGQTRGYTQHSQLVRFKAVAEPLHAMARYLVVVQQEATHRGYRFDASKIATHLPVAPMPVSTGQLAFEWQHLQRKLQTRSPDWGAQWQDVRQPELHPLFVLEAGPVASWEKV